MFPLRRILACIIFAVCFGIFFSPIWAPRLAQLTNRLNEISSDFNALVADRPDLPRRRPATAQVVETTGSIRPSRGRQTALMADRRGHFEVQAQINNQDVNVMIDTGATSVALRFEDAIRIGLKPESLQFNIPISTANGTAKAAKAMLAEVRIGDVRVRNVEAMIVPPKTLATNLLGMSFMRRLKKVEMASGRLLLEE